MSVEKAKLEKMVHHLKAENAYLKGKIVRLEDSNEELEREVLLSNRDYDGLSAYVREVICSRDDSEERVH